MRQLADYRFGIGPMSKNVVDACITWANTHEAGLALIPSRRQVEYTGGYSNGWTTAAFVQYVRERGPGILLVRDHGGPWQGAIRDSGFFSIMEDCRCGIDVIHLDPWKAVKDFPTGCRETRYLLEICHNANPAAQYEIGTEEAIFPYSADQLDVLVTYLRRVLRPEQFALIRFAVIQCGTSLHGNENTGQFDPKRLADMLEVCKRHGLLSKEHNSDYVPASTISLKFAAGLNAANIAPEFGQIESQTYLNALGTDEQGVEAFYRLCFDSRRWEKWITPEQAEDRTALINVCGHYILSTPAFIEQVRARVTPEIDALVQAALIKRLDELYACVTPLRAAA